MSTIATVHRRDDRMFLDRPARFFYGRDFDMYLPMRAVASDYRWIVRGAIVVAAVTFALLVAAM